MEVLTFGVLATTTSLFVARNIPTKLDGAAGSVSVRLALEELITGTLAQSIGGKIRNTKQLKCACQADPLHRGESERAILDLDEIVFISLSVLARAQSNARLGVMSTNIQIGADCVRVNVQDEDVKVGIRRAGSETSRGLEMVESKLVLSRTTWAATTGAAACSWLAG